MDNPSHSSIKTIVQELGERACVKHPSERFVSCPVCIASAKAYREDEKRAKREQEKREAPALMLKRLAQFGVPMRYIGKRIADFDAATPAQQAVKQVASDFAYLDWRDFFKAHPNDNDDPPKGERYSTGLLMLGNVGTGKTLLACGLLTDVTHDAQAGYSEDGQYLTAMQLLRMIKATWAKDSKDTEQSVLKKLSTVDLLVVDEIGIQFNSDTERLILTEVINDRYNACKPTILVSNLTLAEFQQVMGERVVDRFRDGGKVLVFDWPSQRGKAQVIHTPVKPEPLEMIDRAI